jgi:hypothetical protein
MIATKPATYTTPDRHVPMTVIITLIHAGRRDADSLSVDTRTTRMKLTIGFAAGSHVTSATSASSRIVLQRRANAASSQVSVRPPYLELDVRFVIP